MASGTSIGREFILSAFDGESLLEHAVAFVQANFTPEKVFPEEELKDWALSNGFVRKEE